MREEQQLSVRSCIDPHIVYHRSTACSRICIAPPRPSDKCDINDSLKVRSHRMRCVAVPCRAAPAAQHRNGFTW